MCVCVCVYMYIYIHYLTFLCEIQSLHINTIKRHFQIDQTEHRCKSGKNQNLLHSKKYCRIHILIDIILL